MKTLTKITYSQATLILAPTQGTFKFTMKFSRLHGLGAFLARICFSGSVLCLFLLVLSSLFVYVIYLFILIFIYFSLFHFFLYLLIFFSYLFFFRLFYPSLFLLFSYFSNIPSSFFQSCIAISCTSFSSFDTLHVHSFLLPHSFLLLSFTLLPNTHHRLLSVKHLTYYATF